MQLLVVFSPDWQETGGLLYRYEGQDGNWKKIGSPIEVILGVNGMTNQKREGDGKSPAGTFFLGTAFGHPDNACYAKKIPFLEITEDLECVDDPNSCYYNQFINKSTQNRDWNSSEKMQKIGKSYELGLVIKYNMDPVQPALGSAIFFHVWKDNETPTAGCTAMALEDLIEVISWVDATQNPRLMQLPISEYQEMP
jgi:D-alanyl-D-alanine dipeptidase